MIDLDALATTLLDIIRAHHAWAPFIVGALAFAESLAFLSILVPSTVLLLGIGALSEPSSGTGSPMPSGTGSSTPRCGSGRCHTIRIWQTAANGSLPDGAHGASSSDVS